MTKRLKLIDKKGILIKEVSSEVLNSPESARALLKELGMESKPKEQSMLAQANSFALVAAEIFNTHLKGNIQSIKLEYLAPFMVNSSFACELFLKTIHLKNQTQSYEEVKAEHNLKKLFYSLPGKIQKHLQGSMNECLRVEGLQNNIDMGVKLGELRNAFREWRYLHEKSYLKVNAHSEIIQILNALYNSSVELEWYKKSLKF